MDKKLKVLKNKVMSKNEVPIQSLKYLCNYESNYEVINNLINLINIEVDSITVQSTRKNYHYLYDVVKYVDKLLTLTYIDNPYKLVKGLIFINNKLDTLLEEEMESDLKKFLLTLQTKVNKLNRNITNKNSNEIEEEQAKDLLYYAIFDKKEYGNLYELLNKYPQFQNIIYNNINEITNKLVNNYIKDILSGTLDKNNYYYLVFMLLTSNKNYGVTSVKENILNRLNVSLETLNNLELEVHLKRYYYKEIKHLIKIIDKDNISLESKYGVNINYSKQLLEEIKKIKTEEYSTVLDLRDKYAMTIDSKGADCYDDAISCEVLPNGNYLVGVYIADVNRVVKKDSEMDKFAYNLGETVYCKNNITMLHPTISLDRVSLNRIGPKYVYAHLYELTSNFDLVDIKVCNAIIQIKDRLSYTEADTIINNGGSKKRTEDLTTLAMFAQRLKDSNPIRQKYIEEKEKKKPEKKAFEKYKDGYGTNIVSELKVLTNATLANYVLERKCPFIYRVNEGKDSEKILREIRKIVAFNPKFDEMTSVLATKYDDSYYSAINYGHDGIGASAYAHSTTPLRNYSSMYNQRIIQKLLIDNNITDQEVYDLEFETPIIANHLNERVVLNTQYCKDLSRQNKKTLTKK